MKKSIPAGRFGADRLPVAGGKGILPGVLVMGAILFSGCVSAKYKPAAKETPPAQRLNLGVSQPPLEATINSVIVYGGPGSWKRNAYWDEYVVTLSNHGPAPVHLDSAVLTDFQGDPTTPGNEPWALEKSSQTREQELNRKTKIVLVQVGAGYATTAVVGSALAGTVGFAAGAAVLPAYIVGSIYRNRDSRHHIEAEFSHRRLMLPMTIAPGQTVQGSLFFRISPGPRSLTLAYQGNGAAGTAKVDLAPLAGLHLQAKP